VAGMIILNEITESEAKKHGVENISLLRSKNLESLIIDAGLNHVELWHIDYGLCKKENLVVYRDMAFTEDEPEFGGFIGTLIQVNHE
jgi:hypothetical protein